PMDSPRRPSEKSYSEVMNEWAAQRQIVHGNRSRILHPPYDANPLVKLLGYLWRIAVVLVVPAAIYLWMLMSYTSGKDFNKQISAGLATTLGAASTSTRGAAWTMDSMLTVKSLEAKGGPASFYGAIQARSILTRVPFPMLFKKDWLLFLVSAEDVSISLRSGGVGTVPIYDLKLDPDEEVQLPGMPGEAEPSPRTGALTPSSVPAASPFTPAPDQAQAQAPVMLRAGLGVAPDFSQMRFNSLQMAHLNATWGGNPATTGSLTGMQSELTRTAAGWVLSGNGGDFRQGWLEGMKVSKLAVTLNPGMAVIEEAVFARPGGGAGQLTGTMSLGEVPALDAVLKLQNARLQDLVNPILGGLFTAEGDAEIKLSGSVNRISGIKMEGEFDLRAGRFNSLPVQKALHQLTSEDQYRLLSIKSGKASFSSAGSSEHGGMIIEIKSFDIDCGPLARMKGRYRQEQIRSLGDLDGNTPVERVKIEGLLEFGVPARITAKLKPEVVARHFKKGDDGWDWLEIPIDSPITGNLSRELAAELVKEATAGR
ncbi:MAG: hypothetical protein JWL81_722, partial [Verrucomicrobiales bacterium]|nr:hypothetical protein [Verrucomicrobiales bacterium]